MELRNSDLNAYNAYKRSYYQKNINSLREYSRKARAKNSFYYHEKTKRWKEKNIQRVSEYRKTYAAKNKHKFAFYNSRRRTAKIMAFPNWADKDEIKSLYKKASILGMQIDHIVPLKSKLVCGLHVENNLQLLPKYENLSKGNRSWPDMP